MNNIGAEAAVQIRTKMALDMNEIEAGLKELDKLNVSVAVNPREGYDSHGAGEGVQSAALIYFLVDALLER